MRVEVLDHGYVEAIESWGSDERIVETARVSTQKGFQGWGPKDRCQSCGDLFEGPERDCPKPNGTRPLADCGRGGHKFLPVPGDEKLLSYLAANHHDTPFEFAGLVVEVQAPIFVFREWHRHRVFAYSEASARYSPLPDLNYVPTEDRLLRSSKANRQAGAVAGAAELTPRIADVWRVGLEDFYAHAERFYQSALAAGVPKELARVVLPVGRYSRMRAQANLRNWIGFLKLRNASNAQFEIQEYARAVQRILEEKFPRTMALFGLPASRKEDA